MSLSKNCARAIAALATLCAPLAAHASQITYQAVDPSFGGNPANSAHLLAIAGAQNNYSAPVASTGGGSGGPSASQTQAAQFLAQLQSRFISALASNVTNAIFGPNPQDQGQIVFGDQTITFDRGLDAVAINIIDSTTGQTTSISVPLLVAGN